MLIAHRGVWGPRFQNKVEHIRAAHRKVGAVEVDIRYNSQRKLVLCHDWSRRNEFHVEPLSKLIECQETMNIVLDMKPRGADEAISMAGEVCALLQGSHHHWELCSFDQRCVDHLLDIRPRWSVGLIASGMMSELPRGVDFVSMEHECVDDHDIQYLRSHGIRVYLWTADMWQTYPGVDGLIKKYVYADLSVMEDKGIEPLDELLCVAAPPQRPPVGREGKADPTPVG